MGLCLKLPQASGKVFSIYAYFKRNKRFTKKFF
ncbi:unknown [[Mannheimia] succiniciproducens MBEL55E]|uniref:Uncharacterized protein n=1 Tax=Mannheimia succiniciproducens (strain KCTC 0769BP / MBEL55E) TaxID=221988 RepID=Q65RK7_MANSM|nr:unknown [[Mannheimia] succiniciproducens MBEL55E]